ncbi:KBTBD6 [Symbiodinium sp. CCMP2592]|nr:KBTBD6 [Symbiodinium sp. CCMP2592]
MATRGTKRPAEDLETESPDSAERPGTATLEQVSDVRLEFGGNCEDSMPVNSALLRLASPVFNRMFTSGMKEAQQGVINVDVASKEEFKVFYSLLAPWAWSTDKVTEANVDSLLAISDYYQVEIIKQTCEDLLLTLPPSSMRLFQARRHSLAKQYQRCIAALAKKSTKEDLEVLRSQPDIIFELTLAKQDILDRLTSMTQRVDQQQNDGDPGDLFGISSDEILRDLIRELRAELE